MLINDLYTNKKPNLSEGMEGQVVFSGTGADGGKYEIIQSGDGFMIHANGRHIDTYGSLQRAMSVLKNEVPGLQQGMAEDDTHQIKGNELIEYLMKRFDMTREQAIELLKKKGLAEDDDAVAAFLARGGEVQQLKPARPRKGERWQGSAHIGSAGGRGNTKGRVSGLGANTGKSGKPVVTAEQGVDESWKSALGGAALAGAMAMGGGAAQAQNAPSGEDFLPAIVAHVAFKVNGNTVTKDINLGTSFKSPGQASAALEKLLKEKGIKFYNFTLERVSDTEYNNNYLDKTPLTDKGNPAAYHTADKGYTPSDNTAGDYMVKEGPVTKKSQPYNDPNWIKKLPKDQLDALGGKRYNKDKKPVSEVSLGDYRKKAAVSQAVAQTNKFFDRDDAAKVARADKTIANREKGLARADARVKPYAPPVHDAEKYQRDLTAKYPNIDDLVADAERNRDPYYDRAEGSAYYAGREAEQLYQKLKQIQRVIQGLNESRQKLDEFDPINDPINDPISKKKVDTTSPPPAPQAAGGMKFDLMGRPYKPAPVTPNYDKSVADYSDTTMNAPAASVPNTKSMMPTNMMPSTATAPVAKPMGTAMPMNPYQVPTARTTTTPAAAPSTAMTTTSAPGFNAGTRARSSAAPAPELQTIDAPAQLTGPAQAKQLGMANPDITDVVAKAPTAKRVPAPNLAALPAPAAPITPNYSSGDYDATTNAPTASVPTTKSMMPANMMPRTATAPPKPAVSTTAAKNDIVQALKKLGYKSKEAEAAIRGLPPNISTSDAIRQILRGKPTTTESLTWSKNFDPGRSLHRKMKQDR